MSELDENAAVFDALNKHLARSLEQMHWVIAAKVVMQNSEYSARPRKTRWPFRWTYAPAS